MFEFIQKFCQSGVAQSDCVVSQLESQKELTDAIDSYRKAAVKRQEQIVEHQHRLFRISNTCNTMNQWLTNVRAMEAETGWKVPGMMWARASQDAMASCRLAGTRAKAKIDKHMSNGGRIARASRIATRNAARVHPPTTIFAIHG